MSSSVTSPRLTGGAPNPEGVQPSSGFLSVPDGHELFYETWGQGDIPVIHQHGGPGQGYDQTHTTIYDPERHTVLFYDQRASGQSTHADELGLHGNTAPALVDDIARLADHVGFDNYNLAGGSWGSGLSLMHAVSHPDRVKDLLLWGMYTGLPEDYDIAISDEARLFAPNEFARLIEQIPNGESASYQEIARILLGKVLEFGDEGKAAAAALGLYQFKLAQPVDPIDEATKSMYELIGSDMVASMTSLDLYGLYSAMGGNLRRQAAVPLHYFANSGFITPAIHPLDNAEKLSGKTVHIINGKQDMNTPPQTAEKVHKQLAAAGVDSRLTIVDGAGHLRNDRKLNAALSAAALQLPK